MFALPDISSKKSKPIIRYQHSPWYVKIWRWRWKLLVPFEAMEILIANLGEEGPRVCWKIAQGLAEYRMHWYYDWDTIKHRASTVDIEVEDAEDSN